MQMIPSGLDITTGTHIFETPDEIIINSQMYDKVSMQPKPFQFWNTNYTYSYKNVTLNQINLFENALPHIIHEPGYPYYIQDNQNPDIFYFIHENTGTQTMYLSKVIKRENSYTITNTASYWSGNKPYTYYYSYYNYKFLGQTDDYIVLWSQGEGDNGSSSGWRRKGGEIVRVAKSNLSATYTYIGGNVEMFAQAINIHNGVLWFYMSWAGNPYIGAYNVATNSLRWVWSDTTGVYANNYCSGQSNIIKFQDKYYIFSTNEAHNGYQFQQLDIDFDTETITRVLIPCDAHTNFPYHGWGKARYSAGWMVFSLQNIDDKYIAVTGHNDANAHLHNDNYGSGQSATTFSAAGWHKHIVYKFSASEFTPKDVIDFGSNTLHLYGVMYYDQYTPVFFSNVSLLFYKFNLETEKYEKCYEQTGTFYTLGFDEYKRFYAFDNTDKCYLYTNVTAVTLKATFEKASYTYNGKDIDTLITIKARNFKNEYIAVDVRVTLTGPCTFSDGSKELIITTSAIDDTLLYVKVVDAGKVDVHVSQLST